MNLRFSQSTWFIALLCVLVSTIAGCADSRGGGTAKVDSRPGSLGGDDKGATDEPVSLGEGFDSQTGEGTGQFCLKAADAIDKIDLELKRNTAFWAEFLHTEDDIERQISARLDGDIDFGVVDTAVQGHYDGWLDTNTKQDVLTIGMKLITVDRFIVPSQNYQKTDFCNQTEDYAGFFDGCGDQYVSRERLGGFCLMSADVTNYTKEEKAAIKANLEVGVIGGDLDFEGDVLQTNKELSQDLRFTVDCVGIDDPSTDVLDNGELTEGGFSSYITELECGTFDDEDCADSDVRGYVEAFEAFDQGDTSFNSHSSYGDIIDRKFQDYAQNGLLEFCMGRDLNEHEHCFNTFMSDAYHKLERVREIVASTNEKLNHQSDYYWGEKETEAIASWQSFENDVEQCESKWKQRIHDCRDMLDKGQTQELCAACSAPSNCTPEHLEGVEGNQPDVELHTSRRSPTERHSKKQSSVKTTIGSTSKDLCTLSSVRGKFAGGGEKAYVESVGGDWDFWVLSQRTKESEEVAAAALCTDTSNFYDGVNNTFWVGDTQSATSTGKRSIWILEPYPHIAALTGMAGNFSGINDRVWLYEPPDSTTEWAVGAYSNTGSTTAWGTPFGLDDPAGGEPGWVAKEEYLAENIAQSLDKKIYSKRMASSEDAYCFLTRVEGLFDGGGEKVRIYENEGAWMLEIWAGCADYEWGGLSDDCEERKAISAKARCVPYDQSP
jgi:hypothetical protein